MSDANKPKKDILRPHDNDGIREFDNPLPRWWVMLFYGATIFGLIYMVLYHVIGIGSLQSEYWAAEAKRTANSAQIATAQDASGTVDLKSRLTDPTHIAAGKSVYAQNCAACHGADGGGTIGPNLADKFWLHGGRALDILDVVSKGVADKGMPQWASILGNGKVEQVVGFILSLQGSTPSNPKAPQGNVFESSPW